MLKIKQFLTYQIKNIFSSKQSFLKFWCDIFLLLFVIEIPSLSSRFPFNYVVIATAIVMSSLFIIYAFIYDSIKINALSIFSVLFCIFILISQAVNHSVSNYPITVVLLCLLMFAVYQYSKCFQTTKRFSTILFIAGIIFAIVYIAYYNKDIFSFSSGKRVGSFFDNENEISKIMGIFAILSLCIFFKEKSWIKILCLVMYLIYVILIISTGSISNIFTLLICSIICLLIMLDKKYYLWIVISCICFIGLFILILQLPMLSYLKDRIVRVLQTVFSLGNNAADSSAKARLDLALFSFKLFFTKPLFGGGIYCVNEYSCTGLFSHNNFIELLANYGIGPFVIFEGAFCYCVYKIRALNKDRSFFLTLIYLFIFQLFLVIYQRKLEYVLLGICFGSIGFKHDLLVFSYKHKKFYFGKKTYIHFEKRNEKYNIVEIIPSLSSIGGAETFVCQLCNQFNRDSTNKTILIIFYDSICKKYLEYLNDNNIPFITLGKHRGLDLSFYRRLKRTIININPDVVHLHLYSIKSYFLSLGLGNRGWKIFHTIHNVPSVDDGDFFNKCAKRLYVSLNMLSFIGISSIISNEFIKLHKHDNVVTIYNSIELKRPKNINDKLYDLIMVGRVTRTKNNKLLLDILHNDSFENLKCCIVGDGPELEHLKSYTHDLKTDDRVEFVGKQDNVYPYLLKSRIFVNTSLYEGNPISILEAMDCHLPIVASSVGGIPDIVKNGRNGFLFTCCNAIELSEAIAALVKNKKLINEFGNNNSIDIEQYAIEKSAIMHMELFKKGDVSL